MERNLQAVDEIIDQWGAKPESLLQIMLDVNHHFNYLPRESIERISKRLRMPISQVYSVATFFKVFSLKPRGRTIVHVCTGTACHVRGAPKILDRVKQDLGLNPGETTEDMALTLETVNCVGACASAPVVVVGGETYSEMTPNKMAEIIKAIKAQKAA
ncbi:complex I 24 kDa subunit family protein [Desulfoglaeba alkanexedens]|uniref:NAD(P)H-dependent oxidoreductase subunit E n=1 Tax=Desulfoglaeba alkanexedens ALDC TaxID=980445 RepID=A0A4P8L0T6_9BACT|nr:NAD(P)H-dependent oxidoreductase subunit E [Desulfoglaeba alkanexedens]QCQ21456.1 NAD(P)H-dependent oxidoreductase subunit E [Desulfoglaeba alkanexedens ALDC]